MIFTPLGYKQCNNGSLVELTDGKYLCKVHAEKVVRQKWRLLEQQDEEELGSYSTIRNSYCKANEVNINSIIEKVKRL
jgi:hypothetical protein